MSQLSNNSPTQDSKIKPFRFIKCYNVSDMRNKTLQEQLDVLNMCECCTRHQINKPNKLGVLPQRKAFLLEDHSENECNCNCRHKARFICIDYIQMINDQEIEMESIIERLKNMSLEDNDEAVCMDWEPTS